MPNISNPTVLIISQVFSKLGYYGPNTPQAKVQKVCVSVNSPADQLIDVICYDASVSRATDISKQVPHVPQVQGVQVVQSSVSAVPASPALIASFISFKLFQF